MPDRNKLQKSRLDFTERNQKRFDSKVRGTQSRLYTFLLELIAGIAIDEAGRVLFNANNINLANKVGLQLSNQVAGQTKGLLGWLFKRLIDLFGINKGYFRTITTDGNKTTEEKALQLLLLQYGYDVDKDRILPDGYLSGIANSDVVALQIARFLNQSIAARMPIDQLRKNFKNLFLNPGKTGLLEQHFQRFTRDVFIQFDRSTQIQFALDLGLTHFIYAGTIMEKTRDFCEERNNKIFTLDEGKKWQDENWQGKIPGVDVLIQLGGYNCRHTLNFISDELAKRLEEKRGKVNSYNQLVEQ